MPTFTVKDLLFRYEENHFKALSFTLARAGSVGTSLFQANSHAMNYSSHQSILLMVPKILDCRANRVVSTLCPLLYADCLGLPKLCSLMKLLS